MKDAQFLTDADAIATWLLCNIDNYMDDSDYTITEDGTINTRCSVSLSFPETLETLPVRFGYVGGNFSITNAIHLRSLAGSPTHVTGEFNCSGCNALATLEGAPESVGSFLAEECSALRSTKGISPNITSFVSLEDNPVLSDLTDLPTGLSHLYLGGCSALQFTESHVRLAAAFDLKVAEAHTLSPLVIRELILYRKQITFFHTIDNQPAWAAIVQDHAVNDDLLTAIARYEAHFNLPFNASVNPDSSAMFIPTL